MLNPQDSEDRPGPPSYTRIPKTSGHVMRLQVTDLFFRSLFAFFVIDLHSRRVIHVGVHTSPRSPTDAWTAQQLREATPFGQEPKYLIRDRDRKFGSCAGSCGRHQRHQDPENTVSRATRQCDL
jgi:hypothetical protein